MTDGNEGGLSISLTIIRRESRGRVGSTQNNDIHNELEESNQIHRRHPLTSSSPHLVVECPWHSQQFTAEWPLLFLTGVLAS